MGTQDVKLEHAGEKSTVDGSDPFVHLFVTVNEKRDHSAQNVHSSYKRL